MVSCGVVDHTWTDDASDLRLVYKVSIELLLVLNQFFMQRQFSLNSSLYEELISQLQIGLLLTIMSFTMKNGLVFAHHSQSGFLSHIFTSKFNAAN